MKLEIDSWVSRACAKLLLAELPGDPCVLEQTQVGTSQLIKSLYSTDGETKALGGHNLSKSPGKVGI